MHYIDIQDCLSLRVGFKQPTDPCYPRNSTLATIARSGLYVNDVSPTLLTQEKITDALTWYDDMKFQTWEAELNYSNGDKVRHVIDGHTYAFIALTDNAGEEPEFNSEFWEAVVSAKLRELRTAAITETITEIVTETSNENYTRELLTDTPLFAEYRKAQVSQGQFVKQGRFVCQQIDLANRRSTKLGIVSVGMKVTEAQTLTFYLFHSSQPDALQTFDIEFTVADENRFVWKEFDSLDITYSSQLFNYGGQFWLGFYESDLVGDVYWYEWNGGQPCANCQQEREDWQFWNNRRPYVAWIAPMTVQASDLAADKNNIFNYSNYFNLSGNIGYTAFNLRIKASCDYSEFICQNAQLFDLLIQYKTAIKILSAMAYSERLNRSAAHNQGHMLDNKQLILFELYGQEGSNKGVESRYNELKKKVKIDWSGLGQPCYKGAAKPKSVGF